MEYPQCFFKRVLARRRVAMTRSSRRARRLPIMRSAAEKSWGVVARESSDGRARRRFIVLGRRVLFFLTTGAGSLVSPIKYESMR
jgi:hypothetical protein